MDRIRVLLADDHEVLRQGLRKLLEMEPELEVIGEAENGRVAVKMAEELSPDVVIMDISMPDLNGIDSTRQIRAGKTDGAGPKVIALSAHSDGGLPTQMLKAGATGYVVKTSAFAELTLAVQTVMANKIYLSPSISGMVLEDLVNGGDVSSARSKLSPREREVLQLVAEGKATKEAAKVLDVSVKTIETHRRNIMEKLEIDSVAQLTKFAIREGLTAVDD